MIKLLVFCVVAGAILEHINCSSKNVSTAPEEGRQDDKEPKKHENLTSSLNNSKERSEDSGKIKSVLKDDAANLIINTSMLPYPVVTMDARSHNKTAALIRMVVQANLDSNDAKLPKPSRVAPTVKREPSKAKVLDVLRRLNSVNSYQPVSIYLMGSQKDNLHKYERRYLITNFDVIESYIKSRRSETERSSEDNRNWAKRRSHRVDQSAGASQEDGTHKQNTEKNHEAAKTNDKFNYDDKSADYIFSTKRNVWDYEHENWADIKNDNWVEDHSGKISRNDYNTPKTGDEEKAEDKFAVLKKSDWGAKDSAVKVATMLKNKNENNKANIRDYGEAIEIKSKYPKNYENINNDKFSSVEKHNSREIGKISNNKLKRPIDIKGKNRRGTSEENINFNKEDNQYRADRSNKPPDQENWPKKSNFMAKLDKTEIKKKASEETYNIPVKRGKSNDYDYKDKKSEEKLGLSNRPLKNEKSETNKEIENNDFENFKKRANDKDNDGIVQKKEKKREYGDYKESYDVSDKKKNNQGYNDKKLGNDYKDTKKRASDYKDYYEGNHKESKKVVKNQDNTDKKFDNDYKNTDTKDYRDSYGQDKKHKLSPDYNDKYIDDDYKKIKGKNLGDDYKNTKDKNTGDDYKNTKDKNTGDDYKYTKVKHTDYDMDNDKQHKKKNNDWTGKKLDNWPEERDDKNYDDYKHKKPKSSYTKDLNRDKMDDWDYREDNREIKSAKSSDKGSKKNHKKEFDYKDPENKYKNELDTQAHNNWDKEIKNKNGNFDTHANNDWGSVGLKQKNTDRNEKTYNNKNPTTRRTEKKYIDDYDKPARRPKDYPDEMETRPKHNFDETTKFFDKRGNNNWDSIGVTKRKRINLDSALESRGRGKSQRGRSSGTNSHVGTPLPFRERKSVYDDD